MPSKPILMSGAQWLSLRSRALHSYYQQNSPFGPFLLTMTDTHVVSLCLTHTPEALQQAELENAKRFKPTSLELNSDIAAAAAQEICEGIIPPLLLIGTPFQQAVWQALLTIPAGTTATYQNIATHIGKPSACRAVGNAVGLNPIGYLIPCHRITRTDGTLGGFHWGTNVKRKLLDLEKAP